MHSSHATRIFKIDSCRNPRGLREKILNLCFPESMRYFKYGLQIHTFLNLGLLLSTRLTRVNTEHTVCTSRVESSWTSDSWTTLVTRTRQFHSVKLCMDCRADDL